MARKVFISVLGTGFYNKGRYCSDGFLSSDTRFIQQATLEWLHVEQWSEADKVCILLTDVAKTINWEVASGERQAHNGISESYTGLEKVLSGMDIKAKVCPVSIPDGNNTDGLWAIFDIVFNMLEDGDEVYFDLTHGFRYLPMLVLVLGNYSKFLKHIKVRSITYGNYEGRDLETGYAPITDLLPLSALQDWTNAAADFLENGNVKQLGNLCSQEIAPILKETKGRDEAASNLRSLVKAFTSFMDEIKFCRGMDVNNGKSAEKTKMYVDYITSTFIKPLNHLFDKIKCLVQPYNDQPNGLNCIKAARTCFDFGLYQTAATFLQEGIVTFFCVRHGIDCDDDKKRGLVNKAFKKALPTKNGKPDDYRRGTDAEELLVDKICNDIYLKDISLLNDFSNLTDVRNDFNHSGMRKFRKPMKKEKLLDNISKCLDSAFKLFVEDPKTNCNIHADKKERVFINFSNHPYSEWSKEQKEAALAYGQCEELAFPKVSPDDDENDISALADKCMAKLQEKADGRIATVHVMGESGLCFALVGRLIDKGVRCVYSTTERNVVQNNDGTRQVYFNFKQFRDYGK